MTRTQISLAVVVAVYLLALRGCYEIVPVPVNGDDRVGAVYRLNRLTGSIALCYAYIDYACSPLPEAPFKDSKS